LKIKFGQMPGQLCWAVDQGSGDLSSLLEVTLVNDTLNHAENNA